MKVRHLVTVASVDEHSYRFPQFSASSIIIAGGRDLPHHTAGEASPDGDPPPTMVAWINGDQGVGDVYTAVSRDGGRSWGAPRLLRASGAAAYADVTLFSEGQLSYAFVGTTDPGDVSGERQTLAGYVTDDLGESWEDLGLDVANEGPTITAGRLFRYRGHYLLPVHACLAADGTGERFQSVLISDDLVRWRRGGIVPGTTDNCLNAGQISQTQPGEHRDGLIMVMRDSGGPEEAGDPVHGHARFSVSQDGGESWSVAQPFAEVPSLNARDFFSTDSLGRYVAVFNVTADRRVLKSRVKEPRGPWGPVHDFPSPGDRNENVDAVECAVGRYYTVFESDRTHIVFADVEF